MAYTDFRKMLLILKSLQVFQRGKILNTQFRLFWPSHGILVRIAVSINENSDEPAQMRRLARALAADIHKVRMKTQTKI